MKAIVTKGLISLFVTIILLLIFDVIIEFSFNQISKQSPNWMKNSLRQLYSFSFHRHQLNYSIECSQFDSDLFYRLKRNNTCTHQGLEFDYKINSNSFGVRDSEQNLDNPDVIVLGDSHSMGWGIPFEQTFSKILEKETHLKILNLGIASYGTVRELLIARKINLKSVKYIIFQYNDNDEIENKYFIDSNFEFKHATKDIFEKNCKSQMNHNYYLGRNIKDLYHLIFLDKWDYSVGKAQSAHNYFKLSAEELLTNFFKIYNKLAPNEFESKKLIFFNLANEIHPKDNDYILHFAKKLKLNNPKNFIVLDIAKDLNNPERRFILDNHINQRGHEFIAQKILELNVLK